MVKAGAAPMHLEWPGVIGPAGVVEQGIGTIGVPQACPERSRRERGRPCRFRTKPRDMGANRVTKVPRATGVCRLPPVAAKLQASVSGTAKRRKR